MHQLSTSDINKVPASHGWSWINEGVRYVIQAKFVWITTLMVFVMSVMLLLTLLPILQVFFVFVVPFITGGLSLACADIERGKAMTVEHLFKGFVHPNRMNLFRYGFLLILMVFVTQLFTSVLLTAFGITQEQITAEMARLSTDQQSVTIAQMFDSPILAKYTWASVLFALPILMVNMLAPVLLVFSQMSALKATKMAFVAGFRNLSAFLTYGMIAVVALVTIGWLFNGLQQFLFASLGEQSVLASLLYVVPLIVITFLIMSVSYSSAFVAFKDLYLGPSNTDETSDNY